MKNVIIGTAGHIDHGKSALVEALTGTNPDRLEEEKRRGITIDLGFAFLELGDVRVGFVDVPGRWDHWPSAICIAVPHVERTEGTLVLAPGDALLGWGRLITAPVRCTIRGGRLEHLEGGRDARLLAETLAAYQDPNASVLSIVGWGCDPRARWDRIIDPLGEPGGIMDVENAAGALLLVFGSNTSVNLRGTVRTAAHLNVNCRGHTVTLDGRPVVAAGELVEA